MKPKPILFINVQNHTFESDEELEKAFKGLKANKGLSSEYHVIISDGELTGSIVSDIILHSED